MKRFLILILCLSLLTGCGAAPQTPDIPEAEPTPSAEPALPEEQPGVPLLEQGTPAGESGNLLYLPNPNAETMACPEIRLFNNGLLMYEHTSDGFLHLKRISLEDGCLLAEASYPMSPAAKVQIGSGYIGICDSGSGQVIFLNEMLEQEKSYSVPLEGDSFYLNQELETVYVFFDGGLMAYNLESGRADWMLENAGLVLPFDSIGGYTLFTYTDLTDRMTYARCLNLSTATMETVPVDGPISSGVRSGEQWLLRQDIVSGTYVLINQDKAVSFTQPTGLVELMSGKRQLLSYDESFRQMTLYDLEGNFLSRCALPEKENGSVGMDMVWSGYWQGYFFVDTYDGAAHLMFWDIDTQQEGEALSMTVLGTVEATEHIMEKELYERAAELSQRFGLDIRIGEQCAFGYTHYQAEVLTDLYFVRDALDTLERALSKYPEGFLRQLPFGDYKQIRVELVGNLRGKDDMETHPEIIGAFAQTALDHYLVVFDGYTMDTMAVYHEFSHIIDKHLAWDASLRSDALFSEGTWFTLQPDGFYFAYSYTDIPEELAQYEYSGYFYSGYSMTYPTEDRATLMALIMTDGELVRNNPNMAAKMRYYAQCIRDCFDTEGWPEATAWE
ncbi:MAG: hypothetical protein IKV79_01865 [Oscillospiraceae bacterium]|nr:hypothetical protein [Oscillospiraceae bacterium]